MTGFPNLSFTLSRSLSKLLARNEILRFEYRGFTQNNPFSLMVPSYVLPERVDRTLELLGFTSTKPGTIINAKIMAKTEKTEGRMMNVAIPPIKNSMNTKRAK